MHANIILSTGEILRGEIIGAAKRCSGELVFTTAMVGYSESLSDPSYFGQILAFAYPLIGNYGIPRAGLSDLELPRGFESAKIHASALILSGHSQQAFHWSSVHPLDAWLKEQDVPGIIGLDTRYLVQKIRKEGALFARIEPDVESPERWIGAFNTYVPNGFFNPSEVDALSQVSIAERRVFLPNSTATTHSRQRIGLIDCGVKWNIIRSLLDLGCEVELVPLSEDFQNVDCSGWLISNGPGNPQNSGNLIAKVRVLLEQERKVLGICLGHQLLALAAGMEIEKMHFGHRSHNQPVRLVGSSRGFMTCQNHGYCVVAETVKDPWQVWFENLNDGSVEGLKHASKPFRSVQFHPESAGGPKDCLWILEDFVSREPASSSLSPKAERNLDLHSAPKKVLLLGSGGLSIGQAGEFDYSGTQAIKSLRELGIEVVVVNPNIATVQTDPVAGVKVYLYPVNRHWVEKVIELERPEGIIGGFGGQTALNCLIELERAGVLEKYAVKNFGTAVPTLELTEDRELFARKMQELGVLVPESIACTTVEECLEAAAKIGYPIIARAAFALGGLGSGFAHDAESLRALAIPALRNSKQLLIERSLKGWKEVEYEVMRDSFGNAICICNMENFDPLGIHTGDSIVVAPSQSLSDEEFQKLRDISLRVVQNLEIIGECNVQFALSPEDGDYRVIEVNARLSRSSALASKASGYPIAFIAARVVLGQSLLDLKNPLTQNSSALYEPALDYITIKIPRWDLGKFIGASRQLDSTMKSVGEIMAIGRSFPEALQKALRMVSENALGISAFVKEVPEVSKVIDALQNPEDTRLYAIAAAFRQGLTVNEVQSYSMVDAWFLYQIEEIVRMEKMLRSSSDAFDLLQYKRWGFGDEQIAALLLMQENAHLPSQSEIFDRALNLRKERLAAGIRPVVKKIDTSAAELPTPSNYAYLTYWGEMDDAFCDDQKKSIIVLGGGAYRIGTSVEFDWCAVSAAEILKDLGYRAVIINCNPETVSTDFNVSDRLYFDELTIERIQEIYEFEKAEGIIASMGGQLPNKLALKLAELGMRLLGHPSDSIDACENRSRFSELLDTLGIRQPRWIAATSRESVAQFVEEVGFPVLVRPSYVLSGAAMNVAYKADALNEYLEKAARISAEYPVVISEFYQNACEIELDGIADNGEVVCSIVSEHIENAGVHSGDATMVVPAQRLFVETVRQVKRAGRDIAKSLKLHGPFNIQFLARENQVSVIECNARAARTFPFVSKAVGLNLAKVAVEVMLGRTPNLSRFHEDELPLVGVKAAMFSFTRLKGVDPVAGVEMAATGEVGCLGIDFDHALLLALESSGVKIPKIGVLISAGPEKEKVKFLAAAGVIAKLPVKMYATSGTAAYLRDHGFDVEAVSWPGAAKDDVLHLIRSGSVDLVVNIPKSSEDAELAFHSQIRQTAAQCGVSLLSNMEKTRAFFQAIDHSVLGSQKEVAIPLNQLPRLSQ